MAEMYSRWECPLRRCPWVWMGPEDESFAAMQRGGHIRDHIDAHDPLEWVQELIDLRPVPIEVAPLQVGEPTRRRTHSGTLNYLAAQLRIAVDKQPDDQAACWQMVMQVEFALSTLAMEADSG